MGATSGFGAIAAQFFEGMTPEQRRRFQTLVNQGRHPGPPPGGLDESGYRQAQAAAAAARRHASGSGRRATLLTGPMGLTGEPATRRPTLLGASIVGG